MARDVDHIVATKGKQRVAIDMKAARPDDDTLLKILIGTSGKLRAPTLRMGRTLLVGYDPEIYARYLG